MKCRRWLIVLALLGAATSLGAQSLDLAAGVGFASGRFTGGGWWPAASVTGWINPYVGLNVDGSVRVPTRNFVDPYRPWVFDAGLALRPKAAAWTPELLAGVAKFHSIDTGVGCVASLIIPSCTQPRHTYFMPQLGGALRRSWGTHTFVQVSYRAYFSADLNHPQRVTVMLGYTFGKR